MISFYACTSSGELHAKNQPAEGESVSIIMLEHSTGSHSHKLCAVWQGYIPDDDPQCFAVHYLKQVFPIQVEGRSRERHQSKGKWT